MANGFALGGFARGLTSGAQASSGIAGQAIDRGLARQELGLRKRALEADTEQAKVKALEVQKNLVRDDIKQLGSLVETAAGRSQEAALRLVEGLTKPNSMGNSQAALLAKRAQQLGVPLSEEAITQNLLAIAKAGESADDRKARSKEDAQAKVDEIATIASGLGSDTKTVAAAQGYLPAPKEQKQLLTPEETLAAGFRPGTVVSKNLSTGDYEVEQNPVEATAAQVLTFKMPDNTFKPVNARDPKAVSEAIKAGGIEVRLSVQAQSAQGLDLTSLSPKDVAKVRDELKDTAANIDELGNTLEAFQKTPQAGGVMGTVIEKGGGLLRQGGGLGRFLADVIGADEETAKAVQDTRTKARLTVSRMLSAITQEESRFTDSERKLAAEALQTLEVTADPIQIEQSLKTAIDVMSRSELRSALDLLNAANLDVNKVDDAEKFYEILKKNQFPDDRAMDLILDLQVRASGQGGGGNSGGGSMSGSGGGRAETPFRRPPI